MASTTVSNDVSAISPELWSSMVQIPLYKSLVALEVGNVISDQVRGADTLHIPRFGSLSAQVYTPGTALTATNQDENCPVLAKSFLINGNLPENLILSPYYASVIVYATR